MQKIWFMPFLIAIALVLVLCSVYGFVEIIYPLSIIISFFACFLVIAINASVQAGLNPGLEKLRPSFWSNVYNAWLYVTDRKRWRLLASVFSCIFGALFGSFFGWAWNMAWKVSFSVSLASWISGMFLMLSLAMLISTSD
jgi:hypothetical protein